MKGSLRKELKTVLKVAPLEFFLKFLTSITIRGILLVIPILFSMVIDLVTEGNYVDSIIIILVSVVITLIYRLFEGFNQMAYYKLYKKLFSYYNSLGLSKTADNSLFSLSRFSTSAYTNMVITDVDIISGFYTAGVVRLVQILEFLFIYVYFLSIDIYIFISAIIISLIMMVISIKSGDKVQVLNEKRKNSLDKMSASTFEFIGGIKEIKSYHIFDNIFGYVNKEVDNYLDDHGKYNVKFNFNNHMFLFVFEAMRLLTVLYGIILVKDGHLVVGTLVLIYNYYQKIIDNFNTILTINVEYRNLKVSLDRFYKLVEYSNSNHDGVKLTTDDIQGCIEFKDVLYGFRDNPTLDHVNFIAKANSITVFKGRDEAAQNGIFDLLMKLNRQHEGSITIDGVDIAKIDDNSYYSLVSSIRRNSHIFNLSIKDNLTMINKDFNKVKEVCRSIGLEEKILKLPEGYDTIITDTTPISQRTKVLIWTARLLLKESKIILIDDIINTIGSEQEEKALQVLSEMKKNHTIIIISNNSSVIDIADKVYDVSDKLIK